MGNVILGRFGYAEEGNIRPLFLGTLTEFSDTNEALSSAARTLIISYCEYLWVNACYHINHIGYLNNNDLEGFCIKCHCPKMPILSPPDLQKEDFSEWLLRSVFGILDNCCLDNEVSFDAKGHIWRPYYLQFLLMWIRAGHKTIFIEDCAEDLFWNLGIKNKDVLENYKFDFKEYYPFYPGIKVMECGKNGWEDFVGLK